MHLTLFICKRSPHCAKGIGSVNGRVVEQGKRAVEFLRVDLEPVSYGLLLLSLRKFEVKQDFTGRRWDQGEEGKAGDTGQSPGTNMW